MGGVSTWSPHVSTREHVCPFQGGGKQGSEGNGQTRSHSRMRWSLALVSGAGCVPGLAHGHTMCCLPEHEAPATPRPPAETPRANQMLPRHVQHGACQWTCQGRQASGALWPPWFWMSSGSGSGLQHTGCAQGGTAQGERTARAMDQISSNLSLGSFLFSGPSCQRGTLLLGHKRLYPAQRRHSKVGGP